VDLGLSKRDVRSSGEIPLPDPNEGTMLCVVQRIVGAGFTEVVCVDNDTYMARIPGRMRRKVWIKEGDIILFLPWGTRDKKGEIVYRYDRDEVKRLLDMGLISRDFIEGVLAP
jgi:translation initiation factor 1A